MENENMENIVQEIPESNLENQAGNEVLSPDNVSVQEVVEDVPETSFNVPEDESGEVSSVVDENEEELLVPETTSNESDLETDVLYGDSNNSVGNEFNSSTPNSYVTNVYEVVEEPTIPFWENNIAELSVTDTLLFLIFILLLAQFIHNIFKGSHWFKG